MIKFKSRRNIKNCGEAIVVYCNEEDARIFIDGAFRTTTSADKAVVIGDLSEGIYDIAVIKKATVSGRRKFNQVR